MDDDAKSNRQLLNELQECRGQLERLQAYTRQFETAANAEGAGDVQPDSNDALKRAEESLRLSETIFRNTVNSAPFGIYLYNLQDDGELILVEANPSADRIIGIKHRSLLGLKLEQAFPNLVGTEIPEMYRKVARGDIGPQSFEIPYQDDRISGYYDVHVFQTHPNAVAVDFTDITEHKRLEEQLRQAQKMEAVGQLAGGVAHDFNNILQVILVNAELLRKDYPQNAAAELVDEISTAAQRAADLTRQLLAFSRRQTIQPVSMNLNDLVRDVMKMLSRVLEEHIKLSFFPGSDLRNVFIDRGQIEQVLMNLCVNARDAMASGGTLTIHTKNALLDAGFCRDHAWAEEGAYVAVSVTDTGLGMDAETCTHIFEPFFTTKDVGKGTGLGLATVYGIIKQHNGMVSVDSQPGNGTTFTVYLPAVDLATASPAAPSPTTISGGNETILIAEDEPAVRRMLVKVLKKGGYTVLAAADGNEALDLFEENAQAIDLVILDIVMPGLGGRQVMDRIKAKHEGVRFLFSSGYSEQAIHTDFVIQEGMRLIQKPYMPADLLREVRRILDEKRPSPDPEQSLTVSDPHA